MTTQWGGPPRDEATRHLCAAAHMNSEFADGAVREFLAEPTRAVAPSPGIDTPVVLREALAARTRRRLRDGVLAVLMLVFLVSAPQVLVPWLVLAAALAWFRARRGQSRSPARFVAVALVLLAVLFFLPRLLTELGLDRDVERFVDDVRGFLGGFFVGTPVMALAALALMYGVLLADRLAVWSLLTVSFRRGRFRADHEQWPGESFVRGLGGRGHEHAMAALREVTTTEHAEAIVYRGYHPFVGAGVSYQPWSMAFPLDPVDPDDGSTAFTLAELYDALQHDLVRMGGSPSLSPSGRLGGLTAFERVVVPADDLLKRVEDPATRLVLPDPNRRPLRLLPREDVEEVRDRPLEWMRYFRCFQVETWDRSLVISSYLHLGSDERLLYVEWTPCVLLPLRPEYSGFDQLPRTVWRPVAEAAGRLARLPVTVSGRLRHAAREIGPTRRDVFTPDRYGALRSLREMAADDDVEDYFQRTDLERYVKLMEARLLRSLGRFLESRGLAVTEFMSQAQQVVSKNVHIEGSVTGNVFVGDRNRSGNVIVTR